MGQNLELPLMISDMLDPFLATGRRYKVTYHLEAKTFSEEQGRHTFTGELLRVHKPSRFYDRYNSYLDLKGRNESRTILLHTILRIQEVA